jgi:integrase
MISIAMKNRLLIYDPFVDYKIQKEETNRTRLDSDEIKALMSIKLRGKREFARDMFIFCTFTGLAFIDLYTLRPEHIHKDGKSHVWLVKDRQKTGVESVVRLMDVPKRILEKYDGLGTDGKVFPMLEYHELLTRIKTVAKQCGIKKNVTWHCGRHTHATLLLSLEVPIETVSKILGHADIKTTQIYAKVIDKSKRIAVDKLDGLTD